MVSSDVAALENAAGYGRISQQCQDEGRVLGA